MKEAIIVDASGTFKDTTIVPFEQFGVIPIYAQAKQPGAGEETADQNTDITGFIVAEKVPASLYMPRWDFPNSEWVEGLTAEEIDAIRNAPWPQSDSERIAQLEADNAVLALDLADAHVRLSAAEQGQAELLLQLVQGGVL